MKSILTLGLAVLLTFSVALAEVPQLVNYQARLTDALGVPVADSTYSVMFTIYDSLSGGTALWSELHNVTTSGGLFTVLLGTTTPIDPPLLAGPQRSIGLSVGADPEMTPRTQLVSVPYALSAATGGGWTQAGGSVYPSTIGDLVGIGTGSPSYPLHVVDPTAGIFVSRFESGNALASVLELANTSVPMTWEWAISGASSAFGTVPPGSMYFYNQGGSGTGMVIEPDNSVTFGGPGGQSTARVHIRNAGSGTNKVLDVLANGPTENIAVYGAISNGVPGYAVQGVAGTSPGSYGGNFTGWFGVSGSGTDLGVLGTSTSASSFSCVGVSGSGTATGGQASYGVVGWGAGNGTNYGVHGSASDGTTNWAGWFEGNTHVNGTLSKSAGSFRIDHPLDPANKYLQHSFVESPDMMNVYNGNVVLDGQGEAWIALPMYFEGLNKDFRYQLTCVGGYAPVYIADKVSGNRFRIAGGTPGLEVSWQVTGIRKDAYAEAHRLAVEIDKQPDERGRYLRPELFGHAGEQAIGHIEAPARQVRALPAGGE